MQKHHIIPVSLDGLDCDENLYTVTKEEHLYMHSILAIPYDAIRKFRLYNSFSFKKDGRYYRSLRNLHLLYFRRFSELTEYQKKAHCNSIFDQIKMLEKRYNMSLMDYVYSDDIEKLFHSLLRNYHLALYTISQS